MSIDYFNRPLNPNRIPLIHNYCDKWCERCTMTSRCAVFEMEQEKGEIPPLQKDADNTEFWKRLLEPLVAMNQMVRQMCIERGIDPDNIDHEEYNRNRAAIEREAKTLPCVRLAWEYSEKVGEWNQSSKKLFKEKEKELLSFIIQDLPDRDVKQEVEDIKEAYDVIMWFQYFIYVKIMRAVDGKIEGVPEEIADMPKDYDGSAKVALIAIERSKAAWVRILNHFPEKEDETLALLSILERTEKSLETFIPDARAFVRPGFDEPATG